VCRGEELEAADSSQIFMSPPHPSAAGGVRWSPAGFLIRSVPFDLVLGSLLSAEMLSFSLSLSLSLSLFPLIRVQSNRFGLKNLPDLYPPIVVSSFALSILY
jgi:hypothetical protein